MLPTKGTVHSMNISFFNLSQIMLSYRSKCTETENSAVDLSRENVIFSEL